MSQPPYATTSRTRAKWWAITIPDKANKWDHASIDAMLAREMPTGYKRFIVKDHYQDGATHWHLQVLVAGSGVRVGSMRSYFPGWRVEWVKYHGRWYLYLYEKRDPLALDDICLDVDDLFFDSLPGAKTAKLSISQQILAEVKSGAGIYQVLRGFLGKGNLVRQIYHDFHSCEVDGSNYPAFDCLVLAGATGCGKTYNLQRAIDMLSIPCYIKAASSGKWWQDYQYEPWCVVNEFYSKSMELSTFKCCCDGQPVKLEVKGSSILACFRGMVFTTNIHPRNWWKDEPAMARAAIQRRLKVVLCSSLSHDQIYQHCLDYFQRIDPTLTPMIAAALTPAPLLPPEPIPDDCRPAELEMPDIDEL